MNYLTASITDIGIKKNTNQDSLTVKVANTPIGKIAFAVICDGMGGLAKGEVASASVVNAFSEWFYHDLPELLEGKLEDYKIRKQWEDIIMKQNESIMSYGKNNQFSLGTTITTMLLTPERYYIANVGDTRAYEIKETLNLLTEDQTVVARDVKQGFITPAQAEVDPRRSVLLQCVGASNVVFPDMFFGETKKDTVYMLCSDGFRHEVTPQEIFETFHPSVLVDSDIMKNNAQYLIEVNKKRQETDNISVVLVRTF